MNINEKVLIVGAGFIGRYLHGQWNCSLTDWRITDLASVEDILSIYKPDIVVNCIGRTGSPNTDACEDDIAGTIQANSIVPLWLADTCYRKGIKMVHISTGCMYHYDYERDLPVGSWDYPDFFDLTYSRSKMYADMSLQPYADNTDMMAICRIRIPLVPFPHEKNILDKLIEYRTVIDIPNSITYVPDLADMLRFFIEDDIAGIFHTVNEGAMKWTELLDEYKKYDPDFEYKVISLDEMGTGPRTNLIMSTQSMTDVGYTPRLVDDIIPECVEKYWKVKNQ